MSETLQEKKARLRSLLEKPKETASVPRVEPRHQRSTMEPLSFAQQGLWFVSKLEGPNPAYNIPVIIRLSGNLDIEALSRAISAIVCRHNPLRTRFVERDGVPYQALFDLTEVRLEPQKVARAEAEAVYCGEARRPFDIADDRLFRAKLFEESKERFVLVMTMHHSISDAWSVGVFLRELVSLYSAYSSGREISLEPLAVSYADYVHWERDWLESGVLDRQLGYWKTQLADLPSPPALPVDRPRPAIQSNQGGTVDFTVPQWLTEKLRDLSKDQKCSLFVTLLAALSVLLRRYSSQEDLAIGTGVANRRRPELESLVGFFVNTLVLRARVAAEQTFTSVLKATREVFLQALANQDTPYHRVVEELRPGGSRGHSPLFQVIFTLQNVPYELRSELDSLVVEAEIPTSGAAKFDLAIAIQEAKDGLRGQFEYRSDIFDEDTVRRLAEHYVLLLRQVVAQPGLPVGHYEFLTEYERHVLTGAWSGRDRIETPGKSIQTIFESRVRQNPEATALVYRDQSLTYGELNARANQLACTLRSMGIGEETLVGVCIERSFEMVVSLLAVLKAGGAYLPLDPENPAERLRYLLHDAAVDVLLTSTAMRSTVPSETLRVLLVDRALGTPELLGQPRNDLMPLGSSGEAGLAYVMYTSGSTGEPKGVAIEHRGVTRLVCDADWAELNEETVALQHAPVSFDASTGEIWGPLLNGGKIILLHGPAADIERLAEQVELHGVNTLWLTAGVLPLWVAHHLHRDLALRFLLVGGDVVSERCVREIYEHDPAVLISNCYGPTENTLFSCCFRVPRQAGTTGSLPIGKPIKGSSAYVLDESMRLQPIGCAGELYVGGAGLARGYLNKPGMTQSRFVKNPFSTDPDDRLYRTGDKVRWLASGDLEFLGRADNQVKIRGYRIELGEIEFHLMQLPDVKLGAVVAREDRPGEKRLVAYVMKREGRAPEAGKMREQLASKLPEYMIPSVFVVLETLPLTPNGKVDRGVLPAPEQEDYQRGEYLAPRTELERGLCQIWEEILGVERVGIADDFFHLGGHSLLATQVVSRVRSALGRELPLRALFEYPTIGGLCDRLPELSGELILPAIEIAAQKERLALSYAQQRLWFIDRLEGGSSHYNVPGAIRVKGALDKAAFARAMRTIVERHESLRTVFREVEDEAVQVIRDDFDLRLMERDLSGLEPAEQEREVGRLALEDLQWPFDLSRDLLLRVILFKLSEEEHVVFFNMHHIASDGWSMGVLVRELGTLYEAYRAGKASPLEPLRVQYADYAHWQRQWLQGEALEGQLTYWRRQLAGLPLVHSLLLDRPRPARQGFVGGEHVQRLGSGLRERIEACCRESGVTLFIFLQAAFAVLLSRYSQETDIVMGSPIAGRVHRDVEPLIGFFVNTLVLRSDLSGNPRFVDLLESSKQTILDAYAHQHAPFEMLVGELRPERSLSHSPLFQILFVHQSTDRSDVGPGGSRLEPIGAGTGVVKFDLELNAQETGDGLVLDWWYKKELFNGETIARLASSFGVLLESILARPEERVQSLPLLTDEERRWLFAQGNGREESSPRERCIHELFEAQVERSPDEMAVVFAEGRLTYRELNERSNRLAHYLIGQGVGAETLVGLCVE
ncbi:MAG TPA: amino acid adenylation domain-containing protein, partial [Thermoanaerobaculia bacterium]|nr:amino acid adenylation domain-containing protein [Thermoanaerobaculia bacterium]